MEYTIVRTADPDARQAELVAKVNDAIRRGDVALAEELAAGAAATGIDAPDEDPAARTDPRATSGSGLLRRAARHAGRRVRGPVRPAA